MSSPGTIQRSDEHILHPALEDKTAEDTQDATSAKGSPARPPRTASSAHGTVSPSPLRLGLSKPSEPEISSEVAMSRRDSQNKLSPVDYALGTQPSSSFAGSQPAHPPSTSNDSIAPSGPVAAILHSRPASIISRTSILSNTASVPFSVLPSETDPAPALLSPPKARASAQLLRAQSQSGSLRRSDPSAEVDSLPPSPLSARAKGKQREELPYTARKREGGLGPSVQSKNSRGSLRESVDISLGRGSVDESRRVLPDWPPEESVEKFPPRRYNVLTNAGKPVYCSHEADPVDDQLTNMMGVAQAIISIYAEDGDKIRSIQSGRLQVVFLLRPPLYLFCTSEWGEPEYVLRSHLEYLYLQMLSVVTRGQLTKVFQKRSNFDLRRLLEGTDTFCHGLIRDLQSEFSYLTSTLQPLRMSGQTRESAAAVLIPPAKMQDLLYVLLIAGGQIVTLLRPKKHSIHPTDLHLLLNILKASPALRTSDTWLPICLPKFNADGFVYAFISYLSEEVGMIFLSADREGFEVLRTWKEAVAERLAQENLVDRIEEAIKSSPYGIAEIGVQGLRHFFYKSRKNVQLTAPAWAGPYETDGPTRWSAMTLYQTVYDGIHARSGQGGPLKQFYVKTDREACMGWITQPFELYLLVTPDLPHSAVVSAANAIVKWVNKQESKLFLREAPVF